VSWYKPIAQECPNHDSVYMEQRYAVKKGKYLKCPICSEEVKLELEETAE